MEFASEKDIRRRRQVIAKRQVLVHDLDPVLARLDRAVHHQLLALHVQSAMAWAEVPGDNLDER